MGSVYDTNWLEGLFRGRAGLYKHDGFASLLYLCPEQDFLHIEYDHVKPQCINSENIWRSTQKLGVLEIAQPEDFFIKSFRESSTSGPWPDLVPPKHAI